MGFRIPPPRVAMQEFWTCDHCNSLQPMSRWSCSQCGGPYSSPFAEEAEFLETTVRVATALKAEGRRALER